MTKKKPLYAFALAEEEAAWACAALPLDSEDAGVGTIFYAKDCFALEDIVAAEPYAAEEIAAIVDAAVPEGAMPGMSVYGNDAPPRMLRRPFTFEGAVRPMRNRKGVQTPTGFCQWAF